MARGPAEDPLLHANTIIIIISSNATNTTNTTNTTTTNNNDNNDGNNGNDDPLMHAKVIQMSALC